MNNPLILGSSSPYRKALLSRLGLDFQAVKPSFDEEPLKHQGLAPAELAQRLARGKAESLAGSAQIPAEAVIIGSDQVAALRTQHPVSGQLQWLELHKPGNRENNLSQLERLSGKTHSLFTAVSVLAPEGRFEWVNETQIRFRSLTTEEIVKVVDQDQAFDCAGGYKFEKRGISLIEELHCSDPTAIEGLPLIHLSTVLRELGYL